MKELFRVRDAAGKIAGPAFDSKRNAKQYRDQLQGGKISTTQIVPENPRKFFVTFGKDHHIRLPIGKWK